MRVKICGITKPEQGEAIAGLGATALGFICVPASPRYVTPVAIRAVVERLPVPVDRIGVFANSTKEEICQVVAGGGLTGVQLHGDEPAEFCGELRQAPYHSEQLGGTGKTLDWSALRQFRPSCPWLLAGGLTPENVLEALSQVRPDGIDLSSGVERAPGDKDLGKVARLFERLRSLVL